MKGQDDQPAEVRVNCYRTPHSMEEKMQDSHTHSHPTGGSHPTRGDGSERLTEGAVVSKCQSREIHCPMEDNQMTDLEREIKLSRLNRQEIEHLPLNALPMTSIQEGQSASNEQCRLLLLSGCPTKGGPMKKSGCPHCKDRGSGCHGGLWP